MRAAAFCNEHELKDRLIYAPQHLDKNLGQVRLSPVLLFSIYLKLTLFAICFSQTALQVYTSLYKQAPQTESFPLLQKAEVLDFLLQRKEEEKLAKIKELVDEKPKICSSCETRWSVSRVSPLPLPLSRVLPSKLTRAFFPSLLLFRSLSGVLATPVR